MTDSPDNYQGRTQALKRATFISLTLAFLALSASLAFREPDWLRDTLGLIAVSLLSLPVLGVHLLTNRFPKITAWIIFCVLFMFLAQAVNVLEELPPLATNPWWVDHRSTLTQFRRFVLFSGIVSFVFCFFYLLVETYHSQNRLLAEDASKDKEIAKRKVVESLLSAQAEVLDHSSEGFVIFDRDSKLVLVSRKMESLFGFDRENLIGIDGPTFAEKWLLPRLDQGEALLDRVLATYGDTQDEETFLCHLLPDANHVERWVRYRSEPIQSGLYAGGRTEHYTDVTELKRAEVALLSASRIEATAILAGGVAHDFNNLMVAVMGNAELLRDDLENNPEHKAMLSAIVQAAERAGYLATQMLNFARGGGFNPERLNFNEVIREVLKFREESLVADVEIDFEGEEDLWALVADKTQLHEVLNNLINNSVEAIEKSGRISIRARNVPREEVPPSHGPSAEGYLELVVRDDGVGMNAETRDHAFEPFFTTKFQGRGIGLASVYGIIRNHNGHISIESEIGKGTVVTILLPTDATKVAPPRDDRETPVPDGSAKTVLVVDDEEFVVAVTKRILENHGYQVLVASDGQEGLDVCDNYQGEIDLVLLDMAMPRMDGANAFPLLKEKRPDAKVLLFTGYEWDSSVQELLTAGAESFIRKPVHAQTLTDEVQRILSG